MRPPPEPTDLLSPDAALMLDFDGTLVELAATPGAVRLPPGLPLLLERLQEMLGGALAIVTGRPLAAVDHYLAPRRFAGAGLHGVELRRVVDGAVAAVVELDLGAAAARLRAHFAGKPGVLVEEKGPALAVHYRLAPTRGLEVEHALREAVETAPVDVIAGKFVFEARPQGLSKDSAVRALMSAAPFAGRRPIFVGDDLTDEDGIRAAQDLGGLGFKVGPGASLARARLEDAAAVRAWLQASLHAWTARSANEREMSEK